MQEIEMLYCPECGSKRIENTAREIVCKDCGLVISDVLHSGKAIV